MYKSKKAWSRAEKESWHSCFYFLKERNVNNNNINIKAEIQSNEKYLLPEITEYQRLKVWAFFFFFLYHTFI